jgi:hypothetical protein
LRSPERNTSAWEVPLAFGHVPGPIPAEDTEGLEISRAKKGCLKKPGRKRGRHLLGSEAEAHTGYGVVFYTIYLL